MTCGEWNKYVILKLLIRANHLWGWDAKLPVFVTKYSLWIKTAELPKTDLGRYSPVSLCFSTSKPYQPIRFRHCLFDMALRRLFEFNLFSNEWVAALEVVNLNELVWGIAAGISEAKFSSHKNTIAATNLSLLFIIDNGFNNKLTLILVDDSTYCLHCPVWNGTC